MMRLKPSLALPVILLALSACLYGQNWKSILDPTRAIDWSQAGVVGGIPSASWTQCGSTIAAGASAATINAAINACTPSQPYTTGGKYVLLGAGSFSQSAGWQMKSGVVVRGAGSDQTIVTFSGGGTSLCTLNADIGFCQAGGFIWDESAAANGGSNSAVWSSGYAKGTTQIVLTGIGSAGLSVGQYIYLDQMNDLADTGNLYVCDDSCSAQGGSAGRTLGHRRSQVQAVLITGCSPACTSGSTFTITPGVYASNIRSGQSPGASWSGVIQYAGIENMTLNHGTGDSSSGAITFAGAFNCWIKGVKNTHSGSWRNHVWIFQSGHNTIQDSYFYGGGGASLSYGIESRVATDDLFINNIFQHVTAPFVMGTAQGEVAAFNFSINDYYSGSFMNPSNYTHDAGTLFNLLEGNIGAGIRADIIHGGGGLNTYFRNRYIGWETGKTSQTEAIIDQSYNRYLNVIGNVLGQSGVHTTYQNTTTEQGSGNIYEIGTGDCCDGTVVRADSLVGTTLMRWGNYSIVSQASDTPSNSGIRFVSSEVPSGISAYANAVPSSQTLPASFFLLAKPGWWPSTKAWPPIGPDVTGGNIAGVAGHAYTIPAQDCFLNIMGGPADGSGNPLSFNASNCYTSGSGGPPPPMGLILTVH